MYIEIKNLEKMYITRYTECKVLRGVNVNFEKGKIGVILGPSGSGKSTLLNIIGGIDQANSGTVTIDGKDILTFTQSQLVEYRRQKVGFIFQFYNLIPNLTVRENIEVVSNISTNPIDIDDILEDVEMKEMQNRFPRELSGGQQQRVAIARALVKKPEILLCDEPTGALDYATSKDALILLEKMNKKFNTTILIITHNNAIAGMAHKVIKIRSGEIVFAEDNQNIISAERIEW
jgi:putative ABC transport system ATP-binding protein